MTAPSWRIAEILAGHVTYSADELRRVTYPSETARVAGVVADALDCAHGELSEAFGREAADRIVQDERTRTLCEALLAWHWTTGGGL